jgi:hypothetical protein
MALFLLGMALMWLTTVVPTLTTPVQPHERSYVAYTVNWAFMGDGAGQEYYIMFICCLCSLHSVY